MGAIRLILALSVLIHHGGRFGAGTDTLRLLAADMAVYLFFIISGLYIASALERSYLNQLNGIWRFYANRCVRLYPAYWFVVLLAVLSAVFLFKGHHAYFQGFSDLSFNLANVFIIGQDALGPLFAFQYTINAPAWSLSVELMFYALAPFLVMLLRSTWSAAAATLIVIWLMSPFAGMKYTMGISGFLCFFLLGILGYRIAADLSRRGYDRAMAMTGRIVLIGLCLWIGASLLWFGYLPPFYAPKDFGDVTLFVDSLSIGMLPIYASFAIAAPMIVAATRNSKIDSFMGNMCYPIYIVHWPVLHFIVPAINYAAPFGLVISGYVTGFWCVAFAALVYLCIDRPLTLLRAAVRGNNPIGQQSVRPMMPMPLGLLKLRISFSNYGWPSTKRPSFAADVGERAQCRQRQLRRTRLRADPRGCDGRVRKELARELSSGDWPSDRGNLRCGFFSGGHLSAVRSHLTTESRLSSQSSLSHAAGRRS